MRILWLGESDCRDVERVGGKAATLSHLAALHPVPPGFCVTTDAFALSRAGDGPVLDSSRVPDWLASDLGAAYHDLAQMVRQSKPAVAVRSSAVDEDGARASFAGQHETYLNIVGAPAVSEAVARCWASLWTERALEYRRRHQLSFDGIRLAVLVQHLVAADVSGVAFSANPVTRRRDEIVINSSWGLGESIVGGTVTPDTYVIRKADLTVIERHLGDKRRMTVRAPGGTREVDVPRLLARQPSLNDQQAGEIAGLARLLEERLGWPVDVECAIAGGQLYLLQCRRITTMME